MLIYVTGNIFISIYHACVYRGVKTTTGGWEIIPISLTKSIIAVTEDRGPLYDEWLAKPGLVHGSVITSMLDSRMSLVTYILTSTKV